MNTIRRMSRPVAVLAVAVAGVTLTSGLLTAPTAAVEPVTQARDQYTNKTTNKIVKKLHGKSGGAWWATMLDSRGYHGKRWAETTRIPRGHGKRWVGVIHVPKGKAKRVSRLLRDVWIAQSGRKFVIPIRTRYDTEGCANKRCKKAARWAKMRLGKKWRVR